MGVEEVNGCCRLLAGCADGMLEAVLLGGRNIVQIWLCRLPCMRRGIGLWSFLLLLLRLVICMDEVSWNEAVALLGSTCATSILGGAGRG